MLAGHIEGCVWTDIINRWSDADKFKHTGKSAGCMLESDGTLATKCDIHGLKRK